MSCTFGIPDLQDGTNKLDLQKPAGTERFKGPHDLERYIHTEPGIRRWSWSCDIKYCDSV
ncbi:hypothetical protein DPMN_139076 [Dreissena polymorpha]|uniref:Uncharacterized protein n=1 Tax=Dreissena polymorpha TaxID=45954 RepID=A0A9D4JFB6_DREPO|nr:hypothetical protein DPMN_139076 [Dreissena polymorpha]